MICRMPAWIMVTTVVAGKSRQTYFPLENSCCKSFQPKKQLANTPPNTYKTNLSILETQKRFIKHEIKPS